MPLVNWERPRYEGHDVVEMTTLTATPEHSDEFVSRYGEHVLLLLREEYMPSRVVWGAAWLVYSEDHGRWASTMFLSGPSRDDGDTERRLIRGWKERITGRMS